MSGQLTIGKFRNEEEIGRSRSKSRIEVKIILALVSQNS